MVCPLCEMKAVKQTLFGRVACRVLSGAVARGIKPVDLQARDGRIRELSRITGMHATTISDAMYRVQSTLTFDLLDPSRNIRSDAVTGGKLVNLLLAWELNTRPEPAMGAVMKMRVGPGLYEPHAVHWQEKDTESIYQKMVEGFGPICQIRDFYKHRPPWVKKPTAESSLCPYCYAMKVIMLAYARLLELVRDKTNKCNCHLCKHHKAHAAANIQPPRHYKDLFKALFCPKPNAPAESGFTGQYPCYSTDCIYRFLKDSDRKFVKSNLPTVEECTRCGKFPLFGAGDCDFMTGVDKVWYQKRVSVLRTGEAGKAGKTREIVAWDSLSRVEFATLFMKTLKITVNHRHRVDW